MNIPDIFEYTTMGIRVSSIPDVDPGERLRRDGQAMPTSIHVISAMDVIRA